MKKPAVTSETLPTHLAVVIDGVLHDDGTRKASARTAAPALLQCFRRTLREAVELVPGLSVLSLFSPELQRWVRRSSGSAALFSRCLESFRQLEKEAQTLNGHLTYLGPLENLPSPWPALQTPSRPSSKRKRRINVFLNYSGREELAAAARKCLETGCGAQVNEEILSGFLTTAGQPDPDLIVYAGGELEPKDFLLWQASYTEIWYSPKGGLDFSREDLQEAIRNFSGRHRRFGKV